ncbi:hypothetical protein [Ruminococcus sp.]|uniref:hypothetical protein n=1 Tax=Ruminococcus sp. TaxID=41978 RepID=UPI00260102EA|nr:hypothetical protein [Ruminococcus sp.]
MQKKSAIFEKNSEKHLIFAKNRGIILYDDSKPKDRNLPVFNIYIETIILQGKEMPEISGKTAYEIQKIRRYGTKGI